MSVIDVGKQHPEYTSAPVSKAVTMKTGV